jgi:hypothetical protein
MDNDPKDTTKDPSNRDSNKGLVTIRYESYVEMLDRMRALNRETYALINYFDHQSGPRSPARWSLVGCAADSTAAVSALGGKFSAKLHPRSGPGRYLGD